MKFFITALLITGLTFMVGCESSDTMDSRPVHHIGDAGDIPEMNRALAADLIIDLEGEKPGENILISPLSIQIALQMALNVAEGNTLDEMLNVLHCTNCSPGKLNRDMKSLINWMTAKSGKPNLTLANIFFYDDKRLRLEEDFSRMLKDYFEAPSVIYNFHDEATVDMINSWVYDHTSEKIDEIIEEIDDYDLALLINALHFQADWSQGFDPNLTSDDLFSVEGDRDVMVPFVTGDRDFMVSRSGGSVMVDLPFRDSTFSLSLVKSEEPQPMGEWLQQMDLFHQDGLYQNLSQQRAMVRFPKLNLEWEADMVETFENLGMVDAFSEYNANFDKLGEPLIGPVIYINQLKHKSVLEVDEKGAEGAAVTSIGFGTTSLPPAIVFNRPFVIQLRHIPTNTLVFKGIVNNPE
ncbi:MAG: serpin family protein [Saprospirales bacterium]|nr:MAG: serpin family protein [Saprospirales bacterium]